MDMKLFFTVFTTIFIAEMGDKTQLATLLYSSSGEHSRMTIFIGSALALVITSAIGVLAGSVLSLYLNGKYISWIAGIGFIAVGILTIAKA